MVTNNSRLFNEERKKAKQYIREHVALATTDLSEESPFDEKALARQVVKESKKIMQIEEKQKSLISRKPVLKQRLVHLYVSGYYSTREIARILRIAPATVVNWLKDPEIAEMIKNYQEEEKSIVDGALKSLRIKAVETFAELLDDDNSMVRFNVGKDLLDRTGHAAEQKKTINVNTTYEQKITNILENAHIEEVPYIEIDEEDTIDGDNDNNSEGDK